MTRSQVAQAEWEIWIDRGGTFTDIIGRAPDGELKALKLLSNSDAYEDAATEGVRRLLGVETGAPLPQGALAAVKMGTTVATNALLELDGAKTLFLVTSGFGDILSIGDQTRPDIFALEIKRPSPLPAQTVEVKGRTWHRVVVGPAPLTEVRRLKTALGRVDGKHPWIFDTKQS